MIKGSYTQVLRNKTTEESFVTCFAKREGNFYSVYDPTNRIWMSFPINDWELLDKVQVKRQQYYDQFGRPVKD